MEKTAQYRSSMYGFLALVYLKEPVREFLVQVEKAYDLGELGALVRDSIKRQGLDVFLDELVIEYNRLFIGPGPHCSTYESVYKKDEGTLYGETTVKVKKMIESIGLEYAVDWTGLPDHIGVELELMQKLAIYEEKMREQGNDEKIKQCLGYEKEFMNEHLGQWADAFCDSVIKSAKIDFYRQVAGLTKDFISFDKENIYNMLKIKQK